MIYLSYLFLGITLASVFYLIVLKQQRDKWIKDIFFKSSENLFAKKGGKKAQELDIKLLQSGLKIQNIFEIFFVAVLASLSLVFLVLFMHFSTLINTVIILMAIILPIVIPFVYIEDEIKKRKKKIEMDLAIFLDLVVIILEGGKGLNNAIDEILIKADSVLGKEILEELRLFKNELINYNSEIAYDNLAKRTGSQAMSNIAGFVKLSEETGIGVKSVFENQSKEIKERDMLEIEKRAATMNISLTFTMFLFILPAVIAMIAFPLAHTKLLPGM